jgi:hypothetical protein
VLVGLNRVVAEQRKAATSDKEPAMEFDKSTIVNFLKDQGEHSKAEQANEELPDKVDHERDAGLLQELGINPQELLRKLAGGIPGL